MDRDKLKIIQAILNTLKSLMLDKVSKEYNLNLLKLYV